MKRFRWLKIPALLAALFIICACFILSNSAICANEKLADTSQKYTNKIIKKAISKAQIFLIREINSQGFIKSEPKLSAPDFGLKTLIAYCALLDSNYKIKNNSKLKLGIKALLNLKPKNIKTLSWQKIFCTKLNSNSGKIVAKNCDNILLNCIKPKIQVSNKITYSHLNTDCNNQITALATRALLTGCTQKLNQKLLLRIQKYWQNQQQPSGGFGYKFHIRNGRKWTNPYGSITAAVLNSYILCLSKIDKKYSSIDFYKVDKNAISWLSKNFQYRNNPQKNQQGYYDWIYQLNLLSDKTGLWTIGKISWHSKVCALLIRGQNLDGSFGYQKDIIKTSLGLSVLAKQFRKILITKIVSPNSINRYFPDAKLISDSISKTFEKSLTWQAVKPENISNLTKGRIILITGDALLDLTPKQLIALKSQIEAGALLVTNSVKNDAAKNENINKIFNQLFPNYPLKKLDKNSILYKIRKNNILFSSLTSINNDIRNLAILLPCDFSNFFTNSISNNSKKLYNTFNNIFLYISANNNSFKISRVYNRNPKVSPTSKLNLYHINHRGNPNPEPFSLHNIKVFLRNKKINFEYSKLTNISKIPAGYIAFLTGTDDMTFSKNNINSFKTFINSGGKIIVNSAGTSKKFDTSFRTLISNFATLKKLDTNSNFYKTSPSLKKVKIQNKKGRTLTIQPIIYSIIVDSKIVGYYTPIDLSSGMVGYPLLGLKCYTPNAARSIFFAIIKSLN